MGGCERGGSEDVRERVVEGVRGGVPDGLHEHEHEVSPTHRPAEVRHLHRRQVNTVDGGGVVVRWWCSC